MRYFILLMLLSVSPYAMAQPADTLITQGIELASFDEARALGIDPAGKIYVVDAGKDVVVQLGPDGTILASLGGPGAHEGQFNEPADIDPTNGLLWVVADAGNSRIQRFSRGFLHLETLPVARVERFTPGVAGRTVPVGDGVGLGDADGRPTAVAISIANETYVVDEAQGLVLKWDASRRLERAIGGYDAGEGALREPVALTVDATSLYVADRGHAAVFIYDLFGGFIRALAPGRLENVSALLAVQDQLWIGLPERILQYTIRGRLHRVIDLKVGEPLVDIAHYNGATYVLTRTRLLRMTL